MAAVHPGDRKKSGFSDGKYPVATVNEIRSAVKLRHNSKDHSAAEVLAHASEAVTELLKAKKINIGEADELRHVISHARQMDRANGK